jgi:glycosyltransferase involved in cell wall biosynthesis
MSAMINSNENPLISIVLPTYNRAGLIMETIESVQQQTYSNWELLVIDEGSHDNTEELVSQIKDERIRFFKLPVRTNITATRSEGVSKAKGGMIGFIDSDDLWDSTKLEKQIAGFHQFPDAGFCLTGGYNFKKKGEPSVYFYKQREGSRYNNLLIAFYRSEMAALTPTLIFRKTCLEKINFTTHVEFILLLASNFKGIILYEPLLFRRLHDSNTSTQEWENREKEGIRILNKYKKLVPGKVARDALSRAFINSGEKHLSYKRNWKAIRQFIKAWSNKPFSIIPPKKIAKAILFLLIK